MNDMVIIKVLLNKGSVKWLFDRKLLFSGCIFLLSLNKVFERACAMAGNLNLSLTRLSTVYFLAGFAFNQKEKYSYS